MSQTPAQPMIGSEIDIRELITEKAAFSTAKYHGFSGLMEAVSRGAAERLSMSPELELSFEYTDAQELRPDLFSALGSENLAFRIRFETIETPGMLLLSRSIFYKWFEAALGGARNSDTLYPEREPTELELEAGMVFARRLCDGLLSGLNDIGTVTSAQIASPAVGEDIGQWVRRNAQFYANFDVAANDIAGEMTLVLPFQLVDPMRESVPDHVPVPVPTADPGWESDLRSTVEHTHLKLRAVFSSRAMSLGDIVDMQVGQVINLGFGLRRAVTIEANGSPLFKGFLGQSNGKYMLKYDGLIEKE